MTDYKLQDCLLAPANQRRHGAIQCINHSPFDKYYRNLSSDPGEQGWCSGKRTRLPPMRPGVRFQNPALSCRSSLLLALFSAPRSFSPGTPVFPFSKNQHLYIPIRSGMLARLIHETLAREIGNPFLTLPS